MTPHQGRAWATSVALGHPILSIFITLSQHFTVEEKADGRISKAPTIKALEPDSNSKNQHKMFGLVEHAFSASLGQMDRGCWQSCRMRAIRGLVLEDPQVHWPDSLAKLMSFSM